jgi:DNA-binding GntR family transcriptional regulator
MIRVALSRNGRLHRLRSRVRSKNHPAETDRLRLEGHKGVSSKGLSAQPPNRKSLSEAAYGRLVEMLRSGELHPNQVINERHLARQLDVSRTPLREAIHRLEGEKILERQGTGTLVVRPVSIEDLLYICQVRRLVEGEAARRAAGRIPVSDLERLRRVLVAHMDKKTAIRQADQLSTHDLHLWIARACGNPILASIIEDLRKRSELLKLGMPARTFPAYDEHLEIIQALIKADGDAARTAMQRHIEAIRTDALEKLGAL